MTLGFFFPPPLAHTAKVGFHFGCPAPTSPFLLVEIAWAPQFFRSSGPPLIFSFKPRDVPKVFCHWFPSLRKGVSLDFFLFLIVPFFFF